MQNIKMNVKDIPGEIRESVPLAPFTSLRMGGPADYFWTPYTVAALSKGLALLHKENISWFILGGGSNVLVSSKGFRGVVIRLGKDFSYVNREENILRVGGGTSFSKLLQACVEGGMGGLEFLAGVPATMGGAVAMNFGAHGKNMDKYVLKVSVVNSEGKEMTLFPKDLQFGYRESALTDHPLVVTEVSLSLDRSTRNHVKEEITRYQAIRQSTQPVATLNCGCMFKNPKGGGKGAGALIENAGCKGWRRGGAEISTVHANFLVNKNGASPEDAYQLLKDAQSEVHKQFGITLIPEVRFVGF